MSSQVWLDFGELGSKYMTMERAGCMLYGLYRCLSLYSSHMAFFIVPQIARLHSSCLRAFVLVLFPLFQKSPLSLTSFKSLIKYHFSLIRSLEFPYSALEYKLHMGRGLLVCFIYLCMPSVYNSMWHTIGSQQIFVE